MSPSLLPLETLRAAAAKAAAGFADVRLVVVFGSVALGTARSDSDVDIAILGGSFWNALDLASSVAAVVGREAHVVDLGTASELLRFHVARDGQLLYEAQALQWVRFQTEAALTYFDLVPMMQACAAGTHRRLVREAASRG